MQPSFKLLEEQGGVVLPPPGVVPASTPTEGPPLCEFPQHPGPIPESFPACVSAITLWAQGHPCLPCDSHGVWHTGDAPGVAVGQMIDTTTQNV